MTTQQGVFVVLFIVLQVIVLVSGHGKLIVPKVRNGLGLSNPSNIDSVIKLTPFANWNTTGSSTCGDAPNKDPGRGNITAIYQAGSTITIYWRTTIWHASAPGVRVAVSYSETDGFNDNILARGVDIGAQTDKAKGISGCHNITVTLPSGKTSDTAVIQWMWPSQADGGYYTGCADVKIQAGAVSGDVIDDSSYVAECSASGLPSSSSSTSPSSASGSNTDSSSTRVALSVLSLLLALFAVAF